MNKNSSKRSSFQRISKSPYCIGPEIGRGSFASVHAGGYVRDEGVEVGLPKLAIKSISRRRLNKRLLDNLESEIQILQQIRHEHIVQLKDIVMSEFHIYLIMEFCDFGDLSMFLHQQDSRTPPEYLFSWGGLDEDVIIYFLHQIAACLTFLRSKSLIHRDIKPQNILLCSSRNEVYCRHQGKIVTNVPILKMADFGFAKLLPQESMAATMCGSPLYMAVEVLCGQKYDARADLWSVGAVLFEMVTGNPPFQALSHPELIHKIELVLGTSACNSPREFDGAPRHHPLFGEINQSILNLYSDELLDLIVRLIKKLPERLSFDEFFSHSCVSGKMDEHPLATKSLSSSSDHGEFVQEKIRPSTLNVTKRPLSLADAENEYVFVNREQRAFTPRFLRAIIGSPGTNHRNTLAASPTSSTSSVSIASFINKKLGSMRISDTWSALCQVVSPLGGNEEASKDQNNMDHPEVGSHEYLKDIKRPLVSLKLHREDGHVTILQDVCEDRSSLLCDLYLCALRAFAVQTLADDMWDKSSEASNLFDRAYLIECTSVYVLSLGLYNICFSVSKTLVQRLERIGDNQSSITNGEELDQVSQTLSWVRQKFEFCMRRLSQCKGRMSNEQRIVNSVSERGQSGLCARPLYAIILEHTDFLCKEKPLPSVDEDITLPPSGYAQRYRQCILLLEGLLHSPEDDFVVPDEQRVFVEALLARLYNMLEL